jgi:hypothetical protein
MEPPLQPTIRSMPIPASLRNSNRQTADRHFNPPPPSTTPTLGFLPGPSFLLLSFTSDIKRILFLTPMDVKQIQFNKMSLRGAPIPSGRRGNPYRRRPRPLIIRIASADCYRLRNDDVKNCHCEESRSHRDDVAISINEDYFPLLLGIAFPISSGLSALRSQ